MLCNNKLDSNIILFYWQSNQNDIFFFCWGFGKFDSQFLLEEISRVFLYLSFKLTYSCWRGEREGERLISPLPLFGYTLIFLVFSTLYLTLISVIFIWKICRSVAVANNFSSWLYITFIYLLVYIDTFYVFTSVQLTAKTIIQISQIWCNFWPFTQI